MLVTFILMLMLIIDTRNITPGLNFISYDLKNLECFRYIISHNLHTKKSPFRPTRPTGMSARDSELHGNRDIVTSGWGAEKFWWGIHEQDLRGGKNERSPFFHEDFSWESRDENFSVLENRKVKKLCLLSDAECHSAFFA